MDNSAIDHNVAPFPRIVPHLVGRAREQAVLRNALATAIGGHGLLILVGGEAGIGKTSLARDLSHVAAALGCRVLAGSCYDLTNTPPYGPWLDVFEECRRDSDLPAPPAAFTDGRVAPVTDQAALFGEVRQFLAELTADHPALIVLEDLHWADPASIELLRHISPHLRHWPLLLLASYRVDELVPGRPFAHQIPALVREADGQRLDVRRIDQHALRALGSARYCLARLDEDRLVAYLERHAEGNPFFATELLRTLEEEALLRRDEDGWTLAALDRVVVPTLLRQVIDGRVTRLGEETRKALALAAVIGQEVSLALWAMAAEFDEEALLSVVERAVEAHLLEAERDGTRVRFVHALTREALYEGILPPRRRTWHQHVAEALLAGANPDPDVVAYHLQQAGDPRAWEWLVKAADRAQLAYAWRTAVERLHDAGALLSGVENQERMCCRLACRIGWLQRFSDPAGAIAGVDDALRAATRIGDALSAAELRWIRGVLLFYSDRVRAGIAEQREAKRYLDALEGAPLEASGRPSPIQSWFADALPAVETNDASEGDLDMEHFREVGQRFRWGNLLWSGASSGQPGTPVETFEEFVTRADVPEARGRLRVAVAVTCHGLGIVHAALGRPDKAHRMWTRAGELFAELDHHALSAFAPLNELRDVAITFGAAVPASRRRLAADAEAALGRAGGALSPGVSPRLAWLGCLALDGRWEVALQILDALPAPGNVYLRREVSCTRAVLARHRGEPEVAWEQIRTLFPAGPATEPGDHIHQEGLLLQRLAADLCLDAGDLPGARAWLEAHDRWLAWSESVLGQADGQLAWTRYHLVAGDAVLASAMAMEALALAGTPHQPLICLAAHRLLGEMEVQARDYAAAEDHLSIALDLAAACEAPYERALTQLVLAELRLAMGKVGESTRLLDDVRATCAELGAAPTLVRVDAVAARIVPTLQARITASALTQRELEVLGLIVAGRSNQAIADELFISRDTARTHVANIFRKLDVSTRAEAVDAAHRHGLLAAAPLTT